MGEEEGRGVWLFAPTVPIAQGSPSPKTTTVSKLFLPLVP